MHRQTRNKFGATAVAAFLIMQFSCMQITCTSALAAGDIKDEAVRANMRTVQLAAESYAIEHDGLFPKAIDNDFKSFMPGGEYSKAAADGPANPFTTKKEWPAVGTITDVKAARSAAPPALEMGKIEYSCIDNGKGYAIIGGGHDGKALPGKGEDKTLVLSNL